ncbi:nuclear transport factor 2 family protein [Flagellimonas nanhaiensis]|nr:nuclear transport factor 2 family protein [Allomuricauda nanhaiensis]
MKKYLIPFLLVFLISCNSKSETPQIPSIVSEEDGAILKHLKEVEWPKAYREQDTLLLDAILGDDFQMIDASGTWSDKMGELEWIKEHAMQNDSFYYEIKRLDVLDNGTALICGTGHIFNDSTETIYQSSNILVKRKGAWKAVASHVSGIKSITD